MKRALIAILLVVALVGSAGLAALVGLDSGSGADSSGGGSSSEEARVPELEAAEGGDSATAAPDPRLERFYSQEVEWEECADGFECATMEVPLDYEAPGAETIDIALLRDPARVENQRVGSLVVNPGGPGAPGTTYAQNSSYAFGDALRDNFDIVGFDPRGTGSSTAVDCLADDELDAYLASDPSPDDVAERREAVAWTERLGAGCPEHSPGDLAAHVTTVEAARDMDVLRAVLGEEDLRYFGASYGTKLGATYASLFPERSGHLVLDGAVDPTLAGRESSLQQAEGFETAIRAYVEDCVDGSGCFLGDSVEEGLARIEDFMRSVDQEPLPTNAGRELHVGNAFYGIVAPLYNRDYWTYLSTALQSAMDGNGTMLLTLADLYSSRGPDGYQDNSAEAIYAINCLDDPWSIPAGEVSEHLPDFREASPTFGDVFAWGLIGCEGMEVSSDVEEPDYTAEGAAPILVIGTTRDPATPMRWAEAMHEELDSSVLVRRDGDGHTGYFQGNRCVDGVVHDYYLDGEVPEDDVDC